MKKTKDYKKTAINLLHRLFKGQNGKIVSMKEIHKGYTNVSYEIIFENKSKYQVRIPHCGNLINRSAEYQVLKLIKDKTYIYFDQKTGIAVKQWIPGKNPKLGWNRGYDYLNNLFNKVKELHQIKPPKNQHFQKTSFDQYNNFLFRLKFEYQQKYLKLLDIYREDKFVINHTDINPDNIIVNNRGSVFIIDFEWAALAPDYWDYANFIRESRINYHRVEWQKYIENFDMQKLQDYIFLTSVYAHLWTWAMPESRKILKYRRRTLRQVHWYARNVFKDNDK